MRIDALRPIVIPYAAIHHRQSPMHSAEQDLADPGADRPLDWTYKGLPQALLGKTRHDIAALRLQLFTADVLFPIAVLREDILLDNSAWMTRFLQGCDAAFAPHGKTTMSPELMRLQLHDGAWALTAATTHHVRAYRQWGARRIFMANQLVGDGEIKWIAAELARDPTFEFYCLVDSVDAGERLANGLGRCDASRPVNVLLEVGTPGGRAGVRSVAQGMDVAAAVSRRPQLRLCGVETFEGLFQTDADAVERARQMLQMAAELTWRCDRLGYFAGDTILLSGGGSGLFDIAADVLARTELSRPAKVVVRSGCYLVHDDGMYRDLFAKLQQRVGDVAAQNPGGLRSALQVWALVQSKPEPGCMICNLGKRDVGFDCGQPQPLGWVRRGTTNILPIETECSVAAMNDQHAYVRGASLPFQIGDMIGFGVSHPCTTLDKWKGLLTVNSQFEITGLVRTYF